MNRKQKLYLQMCKNYLELDDKQEALYDGEILCPQENIEEWKRLQSMKISVLDDIVNHEKTS